MKTTRVPAILLVLLYAIFMGCLFFTAAQLPEKIATHFDASGKPNGWMNRSSYLQFTAIFGFAVPLFLVTACKFMPANLINVPNRDFWFAPERRVESHAHIFRYSIWLACLLVGLFIGIHFAIIQANHQSPAQLTPMFFAPVFGFLVGMIIWAVKLIGLFSRRV
jgi:uncharacterized membrane protein